MSGLRRLLFRLYHVIRPDAGEPELDREVRSHLALLEDEYRRRGLTPEAARVEARQALGGVTQAKDLHREARSIRFLDELRADVLYAIRTLRRTPGFTFVVVSTLALGIGANSVVFSAVNGVLIEHQPYADASRLLAIAREQVARGITMDEVRAIAAQCPAFDRLAVYDEGFQLVLGGLSPDRRAVTSVSADFFPIVGVPPLLGRAILPEDAEPNRPMVAVLSYRFWLDDFGGDVGVIGRQLQVGTQTYTVVGVMPKTFELGVDWLGERGEGFWAPLRSSALGPGQDRGDVIAHLKPGVTIAAARAQLGVVSAVLATRFPANSRGVKLVASPPALRIDAPVRMSLLILLGAVGCVLLLASANVSALLIGRARSRSREFAIRAALGAGRLRLIRQLLVESLVLGLAGGGLGLIGAIWGTRALVAIAPSGTPRIDRIHLDQSVLWFTFAISVLTALLFGLLPALQTASDRVGNSLKKTPGDPFAGPPERRPSRLRGALVVLELALAAILVVGGTLLARSLYKLMQVETGVRADHVLTMAVQPSKLFCDVSVGDWRATCVPAIRHLIEGIDALPGVEATAVTEGGPLKGGLVQDTVDLKLDGLSTGQSYRGVERSVTPGYFRVMGIRLVAGRDFAPSDVINNTQVAVVSESFARRYVPGDPIGRRFSVSTDSKGQTQWKEIVGVVNDVRDRAVQNPFPAAGAFYQPFLYDNNRFSLAVRIATEPTVLASPIVHVVSSLDPHAPIANVETVDQVLLDSLAPAKFEAIVMGSFSLLAIVIAAIGIYGVVSYATLQRTREVGIRVALGATPTDVAWLVIGQGSALALAGIGIGLVSALSLVRFLRSLLFEVAPADPVTFAGVAGLFLLIALAACSIPARRALRVDPMIALRTE